jgi:hypothetical protein
MVPPPDHDDQSLIAQAGPALAGGELTDERVARLAAARGIDFATAALYQRVRTEHGRAAFIHRIESGEESPPPDPAPRVIVMPGAFAREYPHTGADGSRVFELASQLGWPCERVEVPSLAPTAENAARLARVLRHRPGRDGESDRSIIVVSLSKGGADVRAARGARRPAASR